MNLKPGSVLGTMILCTLQKPSSERDTNGSSLYGKFDVSGIIEREEVGVG